MDSKTINRIVTNIHRRFPEFAGVKPKVKRQQPVEKKLKEGESPPTDTYLLTFHTTVTTKSGNGNRRIPRWVRVVASDSGKIIKVTTSR